MRARLATRGHGRRAPSLRGACARALRTEVLREMTAPAITAPMHAEVDAPDEDWLLTANRMASDGGAERA